MRLRANTVKIGLRVDVIRFGIMLFYGATLATYALYDVPWMLVIAGVLVVIGAIYGFTNVKELIMGPGVSSLLIIVSTFLILEWPRLQKILPGLGLLIGLVMPGTLILISCLYVAQNTSQELGAAREELHSAKSRRGGVTK